MENKIIVPTGYMGSGSSAVTDLLSEIEGYNVENKSNEFVFMHCPNGLFDLEDKLLFGNNVIRSDEAIYMFMQCMGELYNKKFYWPGNYKKIISEKFMNYSEEFINDLKPIKMRNMFWYYQEIPDNKMYVKYFVKIFLDTLTFRKCKIPRPLRYNDCQVVYPSSAEFYQAAKKWLNSIFVDLGLTESSIVLDQLLLPHNLFRISRYFNEEIRVIVVDRDPRDVFLLNKYYWKKQNAFVPYPEDIESFCDMYYKMRKSEKNVTDKRVLRIHFEDLIFRYENTLEILYKFLGLSKNQHIKNKGKVFNPKISINNTRLFLQNEEFYDETEICEYKLKEFLYDFPISHDEKFEECSIF